MKNLWPESFSENDRPAAKNILEEQAKLLSKLTNGIVYAEVSDLGLMEALRHSLNNDFAFRFDLLGKFLESYRFNVLMFSHDITLYPVKFRIDEKIAAELGVERAFDGSFLIDADTPDALEDLLSRILTTERLKSVIGSIMRLSK